ncbi:triK protein [Photobacterium damselae subsp. piscicida]|uniref:TraM recognition domain-containing protein n=1 Tax=Photobacterium damselae TaxID=38293 RepID=UPI001075FFED|nr:TraM recognition domain-containing protein [Photobacterium damselae]TFZ60114.1 triK protein [Photobacterium damselae subsp. piscicida]
MYEFIIFFYNYSVELLLASIMLIMTSIYIALITKSNKTNDLTGIGLLWHGFAVRFFPLVVLTYIGIIALIYLFSNILYEYNNSFYYLEVLYHRYWDVVKQLPILLPLLMILYPILLVCINRVLLPELAKIKQNIIIKQSDDKLSDIREEITELSSIEFVPSDYYKNGFFFFGLNDNNEPIYLSDKDFSSRHSKILGPSQTGKGVGLGVLIDQAIKKGWGVWFNDIKPDDFIYHIMKQACEETGRTLNYLDLNGTHGTYEPFKNGTVRQREERIKRACKLNDTGTNADHYKLGNRQILDMLMPYWDGSLTHLSNLLNGIGLPKNFNDEDKEMIKELGGTLRERIREFLKLDVLKPSDNRQQFIINELMDNADVVYIKGSLTDDLVRNANIALLDEFIQFGLNKKQKKQIFMVLDEVRFLVTDKLANSLATLLSKHINMAIAYQAKNDLANSPDKTINVGSIMNGIETNTLITMSYRGHDEETAKWIAGMTGTKRLHITKSDFVETNQFGVEIKTGKRMYGQEHEYVINTNRILSFNPRVGAFINGGSLACIIKTCWIPVTTFSDYPTDPEPTYHHNPLPQTEPEPETVKEPIESTSKDEEAQFKDEAENLYDQVDV